jgi:hypothetical protein
MKEGDIFTHEGSEYVALPDGKAAKVIGYRDGVPVIAGTAVTKDEGFDEQGNPKRSVEVNVPFANLQSDVGNNG